MASFGERMLGAARFDTAIYEEVEADPTATRQAFGVVLLSSVAAGIGMGAGVAGLVVGTLAGIVAWYVWSYITYLIGTRWLGEPGTRADVGQLLRTVGFASAPGVLRILGVVTPLRELVFVVTAVWTLATVVIAVRQALDYTSTGRAILVCTIGWLVQTFIFLLVLGIFGGGPAI